MTSDLSYSGSISQPEIILNILWINITKLGHVGSDLFVNTSPYPLHCFGINYQIPTDPHSRETSAAFNCYILSKYMYYPLFCTSFSSIDDNYIHGLYFREKNVVHCCVN